jgi:hypothetical protein
VTPIPKTSLRGLHDPIRTLADAQAQIAAEQPRGRQDAAEVADMLAGLTELLLEKWRKWAPDEFRDMTADLEQLAKSARFVATDLDSQLPGERPYISSRAL